MKKFKYIEESDGGVSNTHETIDILENKVVFIATTREIKCEWNGKKFTLRHEENSSNNKFWWIEGEELFDVNEKIDIENYLYNQTDFYLPTASVKDNI